MADSSIEKARKHIDDELVAPLRQMAKARKLIGKITPVQDGKMEFDFDQVNEMGDAQITYSLPDSSVNRDDITTTAKQVKLYVPHKGYQIKKDRLDAFATEGKALDMAAGDSAAQVVSKKIETALIQGWKPDGTNYVEKGIYQAANNTFGGAVTSTYGNAIANVGGGLDKLLEDDVIGVNFNYTVARANFMEMLTSVSSTGVEEFPQVERIINAIEPGAPKGVISWHPDLEANTGILTPVDPAGMYFDLLLGTDPRVVIGTDSKLGDLSPYFALLYGIQNLRYKQVLSNGKTNVFCKTTGL